MGATSEGCDLLGIGRFEPYVLGSRAMYGGSCKPTDSELESKSCIAMFSDTVAGGAS